MTKAELNHALNQEVLKNWRLREMIAIAIKFIPESNIDGYVKATIKADEAWRNATK